jgi:hypothetical protein
LGRPGTGGRGALAGHRDGSRRPGGGGVRRGRRRGYEARAMMMIRISMAGLRARRDPRVRGGAARCGERGRAGWRPAPPPRRACSAPRARRGHRASPTVPAGCRQEAGIALVANSLRLRPGFELASWFSWSTCQTSSMCSLVSQAGGRAPFLWCCVFCALDELCFCASCVRVWWGDVLCDFRPQYNFICLRIC